MHIPMHKKVKSAKAAPNPQLVPAEGCQSGQDLSSSNCNGVNRCHALGSAPTNWPVPSGVHFAIGRMHPLEVAGVTEAPVSLTLIPCQQLRFIYIHACFPGSRPVTSAGPPASL